MSKITASYFEIPVNDLNRAIDFYNYIFGVSFEIENIHGNKFAFFPDKIGALAKGESYKPSKDGARIYFDVQNIDKTMEKVLEKGGKELFPKTLAGGSVFVAEFEDSEGNCIALSSVE
ncbi:MAG: VOC family protein [Candidatus Pacebacteria bacterium]|nr:VOC family protein [Candidatus Paceibacterota bacterium]